MPTLQLTDDEKYGKAVWLLLYEIGGTFRSKPVRQLVVGPDQLQAMQAASLVPITNGAKKRRRKETVAARAVALRGGGRHV